MVPQVALLRAVNVGGTGALPMVELREMGVRCGLEDARTYIASGNLLFASDQKEDEIRQRLERALHDYAGKPVEVFVRTLDELDAIIATNPFPDAVGSQHMVFFQEHAPAADLIERCRDIAGERLALGKRELHIDYGAGIRHSRLKLPKDTVRTARNINTVRKLAELLRTPRP